VSKDCFDEHLRTRMTRTGMSKSICEKHVRCPDCGDKYVVKCQTEGGNKHVCGRRYCRKCKGIFILLINNIFSGYHGPRPCYIKPFEYEDGPERRFVLFDVECTTNFQPKKDICRFQHQVGHFLIIK
jgi:hypothetical protein